jgi:hypothetical protein
MAPIIFNFDTYGSEWSGTRTGLFDHNERSHREAYPLKGRAVKPQMLILSILTGAEKNLLFLPEIEPRFLGCAARSLFAIAIVYAVTKTENQFAVMFVLFFLFRR